MRNIILGLLAALLATTATAQTPDAMVGTWRLVSFLSPDSTGQLRPVWGEHPTGLIVYTADGHVSAQLYVHVEIDPSAYRIQGAGGAAVDARIEDAGGKVRVTSSVTTGSRPPPRARTIRARGRARRHYRGGRALPRHGPAVRRHHDDARQPRGRGIRECR